MGDAVWRGESEGDAVSRVVSNSSSVVANANNSFSLLFTIAVKILDENQELHNLVCFIPNLVNVRLVVCIGL